MKLTLRHSLAQLRVALGNLTQKEMGELAGVKRVTIQAIELGKLKLSPRLAHKISRATGANYGWLMDGDPSKPPINHAGRPYTEKDFVLARDQELAQLSTYHSQRGRLELAQAYYYLRLLLDDISQGKDPFEESFFLQRLAHFVNRELNPRRQLMEEIVQENEQRYKAALATGTYGGTFLTPHDTRACDQMKRDGEENRLSIKRHQKEMLSLSSQQLSPEQAKPARPHPRDGRPRVRQLASSPGNGQK
jgi:DNA-binding XRE family transcriptional regulator